MIKGRKNVVYARVGEVNTTSFSVVHFAKRNTKNYGGEKRSGEAPSEAMLPKNDESCVWWNILNYVRTFFENF